MATPTKHETITEIPDLCKESFLTKDKANTLVWILCSILLTYGGVAVTWAITSSNQTTKLQAEVNYQGVQITQLQSQINSKLDELLARKEK